PGREYLTFDPTNYRSKYEYRASWLINPGCDIDMYKVELACVSSKERDTRPGVNCEKQKSLDGSNCDCLDLEHEEVHPWFQGKSLTQNQLEDTDHHDIVTAPYRYDHLKFTLRADRSIVTGGDVSKCFPDGHEDGVFYFPITDYSARDITSCKVLIDGTFDCSQAASFFYENGLAEIKGVQIGSGSSSWQAHVKTDSDPEGRTIYVGQPVNANVKVYKDEKAQCLVYWLKDAANKDNEVTTRRAITLKQGESGELEKQLGNVLGRDVTSGDVTDTPGKLTFTELVNGENKKYDVIPGLTFGSLQGSQNILEQRPVYFVFHDINGDGRLNLEEDRYSIGENGALKEFKNNDIYEIDLGYGVKIPVLVSTGMPFTTNGGQRGFTVTVEVTTTSQKTLNKKWYLHIDLRHPGSTLSCDDMRGQEYDDQVITTGGNRQMYDIPIYLSTDAPVTGACKVGGHLKQEEPCICGSGADKNCGVGNTVNVDKNYCYDDNDDDTAVSCHATPACELNKDITSVNFCNCDLKDDVVDCGKEGASVNTPHYCKDNGGAATGSHNWECKPTGAPKTDNSPIGASDIQIYIGNNLVTTAVTQDQVANIKPFVYQTPERNLIVIINDVITDDEKNRVQEKVQIRMGAFGVRTATYQASGNNRHGYTTQENLKLEDQTIYVDVYDTINGQWINTGTMVVQITVQQQPATP
ncbi:MAG: hypothetical protein KJ922_03685, partial [Nanoarchaeota archaeon]|nr:hypothetical protein [Nanoarchaeota archaeon]